MKETLERIIREGVRQGLFTNADVSVMHQRPLVQRHFNFSWDGNGFRDLYQPRLFDIASLSKMVLTLLVYRLLSKEHPKFTLDAPVQRFIPSLRGQFVNELTIHHLLTFHARFNRFTKPEEVLASVSCFGSVEQALEKLFHEIRNVGLESNPGLKHSYANVHSILLGHALENAYGVSLEELLKLYLLRPLGLTDTSTDPLSQAYRCVRSAHGLQLGEVSDPIARLALQSGKQLLGSAGLHSSAKDVLRMLEIIMLDEQHPSCPISKTFADQLHIPFVPGGNFGQGFGRWSEFRNNLESYNPTPPPDGIFKSGYSGCIAMCSREFGVAFVLLTNFLHKPRTESEMKADRSLLHQLYAMIAECVFKHRTAVS